MKITYHADTNTFVDHAARARASRMDTYRKARRARRHSIAVNSIAGVIGVGSIVILVFSAYNMIATAAW